ncbi:glycosyl hydrolase [Aspergillus pseudoustus]|uniref:Glycosyl hydrolase n=1 Tax=Aspergillus pseudoustus TaxID=1810923 RepID=A0ABR4JXP5_9EURO
MHSTMKILHVLATLLPAAWCAGHGHAIHNPIIPGWNPDPAVLRVGDEYFIATSSMEYWPGIPIYRSTDLENWELYSHAFTRPEQLQLYGTPTSAGAWAPSLSHIDGKFYITAVTRWTYDPVAKVWPRAFWVSSPDLKNWSDPTWADPWGIDPDLFQDPVTKKVYLNIMAPNNNVDRIWGISQCEVDLRNGPCIGEYRSIWNGTLPHNSTARPEGPKMFKRGSWYYLLIAEGGTDELHRATIARSKSAEGPWEANPNNPLIYNGAYGFTNLTVQSTGHATMFETKGGDWYAVFLARRNINGKSPLGRETFLCTVDWKDDWPVFNNGEPILLNDASEPKPIPSPFMDTFSKSKLDSSWYQLRTPYTETYSLSRRGGSKGLILRPNVFSLSERDVPAAVLRKQTSLNMTFSATLLPVKGGSFGPRQTIGISAYLSELQHQDIGLTGCAEQSGLCVYTTTLNNGTSEHAEYPLNATKVQGLTFHIRAEPLEYRLGYSLGKSTVTWLTSFPSSWMAIAPPNWFVFDGAMFSLFASGNGEPWPMNAPEVGFEKAKEVYYQEDIPDYDDW